MSVEVKYKESKGMFSYKLTEPIRANEPTHSGEVR